MFLERVVYIFHSCTQLGDYALFWYSADLPRQIATKTVLSGYSPDTRSILSYPPHRTLFPATHPCSNYLLSSPVKFNYTHLEWSYNMLLSISAFFIPAQPSIIQSLFTSSVAVQVFI
jgi:hypothetical protein